MPRNVLQGDADELARKVEDASPATQRAVALAVCKWAVAQELPDDPVIQKGLAALEQADYGNAELLKLLEAHYEDLDDIYFKARDSGRDFFPLFVKARVASAVFYALNADPFTASTVSLYELCESLGTDVVETQANQAFASLAQK